MNLDNLKNLSKEKKEALGYAGVAVIVVLAIGLIMTRTNNWPTDIFEPLGLTKKEVEEKTINTKSPSQVVEENYTYEESLEVFDGLTMQIANCIARPFSVTYKNNTRVFLDGRSPDAQKIIIGSKSVILDAYSGGYMTLSANELPATLSVNCQTQGQDYFNIATIKLQQ